MQNDEVFIQPDWPVPPAVRAFTTTRRHPSGNDRGEFNLALHVEDDRQRVLNHRAVLREALALPSEPVWLNQVHGCETLELKNHPVEPPRVDASFTRESGMVCVVLTADCLPVLLCNTEGSVVAAVHAGWRGLQQNIIAATVQRMGTENSRLMAWLGPAIGANAYEVDETVYRRFDHVKFGDAFHTVRVGHWLMNVYAVARRQLADAGVSQIYGGERCTFSETECFFSYRREKRTGRMASLIWIDR